MIRSAPLSLRQIALFKQAASGFSGEVAQEKIALAVLECPQFRGKEITVGDTDSNQVYFRLGAQGRHGIAGVHVHLPFEPFDEVTRNPSGVTRAGKQKKQIVPLVGCPRQGVTAHNFVAELLKALEQGRYQASFVND